MIKKNVSQLIPGDKIVEDVITSLGGTLFYKGKNVTTRDLEILRAFLIPHVMIDGKFEAVGEKTDSSELEPIALESPLHDTYDQVLVSLKQLFKQAHGANLAILEIRQNLEKLIGHMDQYQVLSFTPRNFKLDEALYHNSIMCSMTSYSLAKWHGLPQKDWVPIALAGLLHDIGNVKLNMDMFLLKRTLSQEEMEDVKRHTVMGYNLLKNVAGLNDGVKLTALQHHERENGSGYPLGVKGDKIHLYAKVVAIADVYHAMTSPRSYKPSYSPYIVLEELFNESFGKLEPSMVQTFINKATQFHNGVVVKLNNGKLGEIVFSDRANPTRPWVSVEGKIVNLTQERQLFIEQVIQ